MLLMMNFHHYNRPEMWDEIIWRYDCELKIIKVLPLFAKAYNCLPTGYLFWARLKLMLLAAPLMLPHKTLDKLVCHLIIFMYWPIWLALLLMSGKSDTYTLKLKMEAKFLEQEIDCYEIDTNEFSSREQRKRFIFSNSNIYAFA